MLALAAGVAAVVLLARDDSEDADEAARAAVTEYVVEVNTTQQALILQLEQVSTAYRSLRLRTAPDPAQVERLTGAGETLRDLRRRLAAIAAPPEAAKLRRLLLGLVDLQVELAAEVRGMATYIPLQAAANRELAEATNALREVLEDAETGEAQRGAFDTFDAAVQRVVRRLEALSAPDVLEPSRTGEIERLTRLGKLARELGVALAEQKEAEVDRLFPRFVQTSTSTGTTAAERAAVIAFNARLQRIGEQRTAVVRERSRLDLALR